MTTTKVQSEFIAADAVTGAKIADDAIDSEHYTDGSIDTAHLAADAVTGAKIADDAIDSEHYTDGSIDAAHLAAAQTNITSVGTLTGLTVNGAAVFNENSADVDFRIEGNGEANLFCVRADNDMVGIGTATPTRTFEIVGKSGSYYPLSVTSTGTEHIARFYGTGSCGLGFHGNDSNSLFRINSEGSDDDLAFCVSDGEEALRLTANKHVKVKYAAYTEQVAITSSSNATAWDARAAANAYYATSENTTFSAPTNAVEGAVICVEIAQGGTARTVAWNTIFEFAASTAPTITATANKTDILTFRYNGSVWQEIGRSQNMAQT